jgi:putative redox protein
MTLSGTYQGELRTLVTHTSSKATFVTDAPIDNHGLGQAFSPTDTLAASLGSCMATVMSIEARQHNIDPIGMRWEIIKTMAANPRRISHLKVDFYWDNAPTTPGLIDTLKNIGLNCPVSLSLHPDLIQEITFHF